MKTLTFVLALSLTVAAAAPQVYAAEKSPVGTLNVVVRDANGAIVDAPVYIFGTQKTRFIGGKEVAGSATFELKPGTYKVSSALVKKTGDYLDRYASHEAQIQVVEGDNTMVTLTLKALDDPMNSITTAELDQIGIAPRVARNLN